MRKIVALLLVGGLIAAAPSIAEAGKKSKPVKAWEDPTGDADAAAGTGASLPLGFDLTGGTINRVGKNLEFTVTHADMPPVGSAPEAFRFLWAFNVDGKNYRLTVKSADIGKPDVAAGQTDERVGRVDAQGHFRLEGECARDATLPVGMINCPPVAYLDGTWDPASMSFTVIIPLKTVKAKPGSLVAPGGGENVSICSICWVTHYAERSLNTTVIDAAGQTVTYKVPK